MYIVFIILKTIGLILAVILGILLLFGLAFLFVPLRYVVDVKRESDWNGRLKLSWLLHMVTLTIAYKENKADVRFRLFGIRLFRGKDKNKKGRSSKRKRNKRPNTRLQKRKKKEIRQGKADGLERLQKKHEKEDVGLYADKLDDEGESDEFVRRKSKQSIFSKVKDIINSIKSKWKSFIDSLKSIRLRARDFFDLFSNNENNAGVRAIKKEMIRLWKHSSPKKFKATLKLGFGDPCYTGLVLGALSILYAHSGGKFDVEPDFYEEVFVGYVFAKGRIKTLTVLLSLLRLYRNEQVMGVVRGFRDRLA